MQVVACSYLRQWPHSCNMSRNPATPICRHALARSPPELPQCANHTALCAKDKAWYFCKAGATAITDKGAALALPPGHIGSLQGGSGSVHAGVDHPSRAPIRRVFRCGCHHCQTSSGWKLLNATLTAAATTAAGPKAAAHDMSGHDMAGHDHDMAGHDMAGHDHDHDMAGHNKTAPRGLYESPASANTTKPKAASRAACAVAAPLLVSSQAGGQGEGADPTVM
jgi:hypothetical protein